MPAKLDIILARDILASAIAAYEVWLAQEGGDLNDLLDSAFRQITRGLAAVTRRAASKNSAAPG